MRIHPTVRTPYSSRRVFDRSSALGLFTLLLFTQTGCSLFFGNIRPVEEKSKHYHVIDLSQKSEEWEKLENQSSTTAEIPEQGSVSDTAFQSNQTAAIISLNSACKQYESKQPQQSLKKLSSELFLGITDVTFLEEKELVIQGVPALETTIRGQLSGEDTQLRAVVLQKQNCVYDLMYIARPEKFEKNLRDFSRFVSSLSLK
jgi:hypothetical protein